jgi:RNA polymerase sigma-70 factor (ECF subfamily)
VDDFARIDECLQGRPEAFGPLVEKYEQAVYGVVSRMISDRETARDVAQEAFLRAYRGLASFQRESSFATWLFRIAINLCQSERRRTMRRRKIGGAARGWGTDPEAPEPEIPDRRFEPLGEIQGRERRELVLGAIERMQEESRGILVLRDFQGLSYREIADILDCPVGTVRSRLFRARSELRSLLEGALGGTDR